MNLCKFIYPQRACDRVKESRIWS